jgi:hypothetical protein
MKHLFKAQVLSVCMIAISGCSTITTGTTQNLTILTPHAEGAKCSLKDSKQAQWYVDQTPGTVLVQKGDGPMIINCAKEGYKETSLVVKEGLAGMTFGNVILGGGVGVIVDAASGAAQEYPDQVTVWMEPNTWASEKEKQDWFAEKQKFEDDMKAKEKQAHNQSQN